MDGGGIITTQRSDSLQITKMKKDRLNQDIDAKFLFCFCFKSLILIKCIFFVGEEIFVPISTDNKYKLSCSCKLHVKDHRSVVLNRGAEAN